MGANLESGPNVALRVALAAFAALATLIYFINTGKRRSVWLGGRMALLSLHQA